MTRPARFSLGIGLGLALVAILLVLRLRSERLPVQPRLGPVAHPEAAPTSELDAPISLAGEAPTETARVGEVVPTRVEVQSDANALPASSVGVRVHGRVIDEHSVPVVGAFVSLRRGSALTPKTDAEGRFAFENVPPGSWTVSASSFEISSGAEEVVDTTAGEVELELRVQRGTCVQLRVRWSDGEPVAKVSILLPTIYVARGMTRSSDRDRPPGTYTVCGLGERERTIVVKAQRDGLWGLCTAPLERPNPGSLDLVLEPWEVVLRGTVLDEEGAPVAGTALTLQQLPLKYVDVGADGSFESRELEPGSVQVRVSAPGHWATPVWVELVPELEPIRIVLRKLATVRGQVLDVANRPVAGARVLGGVPEASGFPRTGVDGRFEALVQPGGVQLSASAEGHAPSESELVVVPLHGSVDGIVLRLRPACRVSGRVLDPQGQPVAHIGISLLGMNAFSDEAGRFLFDTVPPGEVELEAFDDDAYASARVLARTDLEAEVELRFAPQKRIQLTAHVTRGGAPVEASVYLRTTGFQRHGWLDSRAGLDLELQAPGRWRGSLSLVTPYGDDPLASARLLDFIVPDVDELRLDFDWDALRRPASEDELWGHFTD